MIETGTRIGPYEIKEQIGEGGMAVVYKVWHVGLHRFEALKVPRHIHDYGPNRDFVQRLIAEARIAAQLRHPHVVTIHNVSEPEAPVPFFAMDLVDGYDLAALLERRGKLPIAEVLSIIRPVAQALDYAHSRGIIHRDIKPGNILLAEHDNGNDWDIKVVDFGISHAAEDTEGTRLTKSGMIVGTAEYMSPEQAGSGHPVDYRTDIYSLGIVAYEMLCGRPPFVAVEGANRMSILMSHVHHEPRPPVDYIPTLSTAANNAVLKALAKHPEDRFSTCTAFIEALSGAVFVRPPKEPNTLQAPSIGRSSKATVPSIIAQPNAETIMRTPPGKTSRERLFQDTPQGLDPEPTAIAPESEPTPAPTLEIEPATSARPKSPSPARALTLGLAIISTVGMGVFTVLSSISQPNQQAANTATNTAIAPATPAPAPEMTPQTATRKATPITARKVTRVTRTQAIPYPKRTQKTAALKVGQQRIKQSGQPGQQQSIVEVITEGSRQISRRVVSSRIIKQPIAQLELIGTAPRLTPKRFVPQRVTANRSTPRRVTPRRTKTYRAPRRIIRVKRSAPTRRAQPRKTIREAPLPP